MEWDIILHCFWQMADRYKFDYAALTDDHKQMLESMHETLIRIWDVRYAPCMDLAIYIIRWFPRP